MPNPDHFLHRAFDAAVTAVATTACRLLCWALRLRAA